MPAHGCYCHYKNAPSTSVMHDTISACLLWGRSHQSSALHGDSAELLPWWACLLNHPFLHLTHAFLCWLNNYSLKLKWFQPMYGRDFLLPINIKCYMHESCIDWKVRGEVALWHAVPTSSDTKLINNLVPGTGFSHAGFRCSGRPSLWGNRGCKHGLGTIICGDSEIFTWASSKGSDWGRFATSGRNRFPRRI